MKNLQLQSSHLAVLALSLSLLTFGAAPSAAQEELPGIFGEIIDVRVVNLEIVVTDRRGNRVTGLSPEDFRLLVDGQPVPIDYFSEVVGGVAVAPSAGAGSAVQSLPGTQPGEEVGTSYLLFVDDFFAFKRDRDRVLQRVRDQLGELGPRDRLAMVAYDGRKVEMLTSWTNRDSELDRAFRRAFDRPAYGLQRIAEARTLDSTRRLGITQIDDPRLFDIGRRLTTEERDYVGRLQRQIEGEISAAAATLRSFAKPPGRKVLILMSGGWPFDPPQFATEDQTVPVLDAEFDRGFDLYKPLADTANLLGYTIYPVDVPGLRGNGPSAEQATVSPVGTPAAITQEREIEGSLLYLAKRTGGRALLNAQRDRVFEQVAQDTRSYYWLGFSPQRQWDGVQHQIKIEVLQPGLKVRSRKGYLDFSRTAEVTAMVESTLLFGSGPPSGPLPVKVGSSKKVGRRKIEVPLTVAIPVDEITVLPIGDRFVSELELRIAVMDEDGNQADIPVVPLRLDGEEKPEAGRHIRYETSLKLRREDHEIVVSIYDPASGRILTNRFELSL